MFCLREDRVERLACPELSRRVRPWLRLALLAIALALLGCGGGHNSQESQTQSQQTESLGATVDATVQPDMQQSGVPGMTVAVAKGNQILYAKGYGVADRASQKPVTTATVFEIGSISKQFTAARILQLQEQGLLHIDDSAGLYLPGYGFSPAITIRMLLTHTSGLADFTNFSDFGQWVRNGISVQAALTEIAQAPLQFQPGSRWAYSNSNYYLLGAVIENLTGRSYANDVEASELQPLGLSSTYYDLPPPNVAATGYTNNGAGLVPALIWDRSAAYAAGALSSDVADLVKWEDDLRTGKVLSPASFQQMTTPDGFSQNGFSYGLGVALSTQRGRTLMWHSGQIGGFTAEEGVFLDDGFAVVVLTNDQDYNTDPITIKLINAVCGDPQLAGDC